MVSRTEAEMLDMAEQRLAVLGYQIRRVINRYHKRLHNIKIEFNKCDDPLCHATTRVLNGHYEDIEIRKVTKIIA